MLRGDTDATYRDPETFREFLHARKIGSDRSSSRRTRKEDFKEIAEANSVGFARTLKTFDNIESLSLSEIEGRFVLKADNFTSAFGVFLLEKFGSRDTTIYDWMERKPTNIDTLRSSIKSAAKILKRSEYKLIIEEFVRGENHGVPFDYKVYTFRDGPAFILQIDRNTSPPRMAFFDGDFSPMEKGKVLLDLNVVGPGKPVRPACAESMLEDASKIVRSLDTPFASVDMYASQTGPVLGEITYAPGGVYNGKMFYLAEHFDRELGTRWRESTFALGQNVAQITGTPPQFLEPRPLVDQRLVWG